MRVGSLFTGYGGLELAVESLWPGTAPAWFVENDPAASAVLTHRWPDVPNLGDITAIDWTRVPPVDIVTGGFPCQDLSHAGKRLGLKPDTRSGLWDHMAYAVAHLHPRLVLIENVRGLLSADAHSDLERDCWCVGDTRDSHLRALGAVLGDLADLRYDARWVGVRAADAGAPHGRFRVFIAAADTARERGHGARFARPQRWPEPADGGGGPVSLLPTPTARDWKGRNQRDDDTCLPGALLPTPAVNDMGAGKTVAQWDEWTDRMRDKHGNGNGHGASLSIEALRLLPTPTAADGSDRSGELLLPGVAREMTADFGPYTAAVACWEHVLGRPAPPPTEPGQGGRPRLSPRFVEWLMGLPDGHVTDTPGLSRSAQLKILGNGIVPAQMALAVTLLLDDTHWRAA